jgi:Ni,Fe-hydrogenase I cytochrome b subunit
VKKSVYSKGPQWWLRGLFFIIGVLPQGIRLASFRNTPWTKIIGFIFLGHFLVGEVLILLASRILIPTFAPFLKEDDKSKLRDWSYWVAFLVSLFFPVYLALQQLLIFINGTDSDVLLLSLFLFAVLLPTFLLYVFLCVFAVGSGLEKITKLMAGRYPDVVRWLMLAVETDTGVVKVDGDAVWLLGLLVINLVYCVLGYRFVYEPFETVDPGWRGIFS